MRHITHEHGHTGLFLDHDVADVLQRADQAHASDQVLLVDLRQDAATGVGVVGGNGLHHLLHRQVVVPQTSGVDQRLILLDVAALRVDLGHACNGTQQGPHDPVLHGTALGQFLGRQCTLTVIRALQRVLVHLAQAGGHRPQHRCDACGHAGCDLDQPLGHQLPGEVNIGLVGEDQGDDGQAAFVE